MLPTNLLTNLIIQSPAITTLMTVLMQLAKPYVEKLPFANPAAPDQTSHDATLEVTHLLLQGLAIVVVNVGAGTLSWQQVPAIAVQTAIQWALGRALYQQYSMTVKSKPAVALSGASVSSTPVVSAPATHPASAVMPADVAAAQQAALPAIALASPVIASGTLANAPATVAATVSTAEGATTAITQ